MRDELLKCFESANKEFMEVLHQPATDAAIKAQVQQFVSGVFQNCGVSFDHPSKAGILTAIGQCKTNAEAMMGPAGSCDHCAPLRRDDQAGRQASGQLNQPQNLAILEATASRNSLSKEEWAFSSSLSMSISPTTFPSFDIGTTISDFVLAKHSR